MNFRKATFVLCVAGLAGAAQAQYSSDFESLMANPQGVILTGQDGYYLPTATSTDFEAFTYAGNLYRLPQNPNGGTTFIAGTGEAGGTFERAQRDISYPTGVVTMQTDIAAAYTGTLPSAQNIGSLSSHDDSASGFSHIQLATWSDPATADAWDAQMIWFDAAGTQLQEQLGAGFMNLSTDTWYTWSVSFDFASKQILEVSLTDIVAGTTETVNPQDRFLRPGATLDGFRFFAGGGVIGNSLAFDNIAIVPAPGAFALLGLGGLIATRRRR